MNRDRELADTVTGDTINRMSDDAPRLGTNAVRAGKLDPTPEALVAEYLKAMLLDGAWHPATPCDEGLIVASDNGSTFAPTFGLAIHFRDTNDPRCDPGR